MKKLAFIFAMLTFLPFIARAENVLNKTDAFTVAKAVKLGRGSSVGAYSSGTFGNSGSGTKLAKDCDKNCASCDTGTGTCYACKSGYYLTKNAC